MCNKTQAIGNNICNTRSRERRQERRDRGKREEARERRQETREETNESRRPCTMCEYLATSIHTCFPAGLGVHFLAEPSGALVFRGGGGCCAACCGSGDACWGWCDASAEAPPCRASFARSSALIHPTTNHRMNDGHERRQESMTPSLKSGASAEQEREESSSSPQQVTTC
jgi:hypothetical protein